MKDGKSVRKLRDHPRTTRQARNNPPRSRWPNLEQLDQYSRSDHTASCHQPDMDSCFLRTQGHRGNLSNTVIHAIAEFRRICPECHLKSLPRDFIHLVPNSPTNQGY
ncbi:hypothetical protein V6N13_115225 [Hibiscus sabdariffa]